MNWKSVSSDNASDGFPHLKRVISPWMLLLSKAELGFLPSVFHTVVETEKCFCWSSLTYGVGASPGAPRPVSIGQTFQHPCSIVNSSLEAAVAFNPRVNHCRPESRTALLHFHWGIWLIGGWRRTSVRRWSGEWFV